MRILVCITALLLGALASAHDTRHPLAQAIDVDANLLLVADLQPNRTQLLDILTAARAARQLVTEYETRREQAAAANAEMFKQQAKALAEGTPVDPKITKAIDLYHATQKRGQLMLLRGVDAQIRQMRRALAPDQVRLIDWNRPAEIGAGGDNQAVLEELRQLFADLNETARMLERIRYLIASDYMTTRLGRLAEFLRDYIRPGTEEFRQAMDWMLRLTDEVRMVPENDWPQQAPLFAGRVLQRLGALSPQQRSQAAAPYNWWDVYYLLTDAQTPEMLQQVLAARGNPAE